MSRRTPAAWFAVAGAVVFYLGLAAATAWVREPYHDEGVTYDQVVGTLRLDACPSGCTVAALRAPGPAAPAEIAEALLQRGMHPPAYYLILGLWSSLFGTSLFVVRLLGVCLGGLAVAGIAALAGLLFHSPAVRVCAAWLSATSPWLIQLGAYARPYAFAVAIAAWSALALLAAARAKEGRRSDLLLLAWVGLSALGVYTLYHYAFVAVAQGTAWLLHGPGTAPRRAGTLLGGALGASLLYTLWLPAALHHFAVTRGPVNFDGRGRYDAAVWPEAACRLVERLLLGELRPAIAHALAIVTLGLVAWAFWRFRLRLPRPCVTYFAVFVGALLAADLAFDGHTLFVGKHVFGLVPVLLVSLSALALVPSGPRPLVVGFVVAAFVGTSAVRIVRDTAGTSDLRRLVSSLPRSADATLLVLSTARRGYAYPLVLELERSGMGRARLCVTACSPEARRPTYVEFRVPADVPAGPAPPAGAAVFRDVSPRFF